MDWLQQITTHQSGILSGAQSTVDKDRLLNSGDWLPVPPITAVGLRLVDEAVRIAVAHRLGCKACEPLTCVCGKAIDGRGLHGLSAAEDPQDCSVIVI